MDDGKAIAPLYNRLEDSFMSLANEYRISERWREHFHTMFCELKQPVLKKELINVG